MTDNEVQRGLEDVIALESQICFIDGKKGRLLYRGYDIRDLAQYSTFEEVAYLLWNGRLPTADQREALRARLGELRTLPEPVMRIVSEMPQGGNAMDVLRTAVSALGAFTPAETGAASTSVASAERLTAILPAIIGQLHRARQGLPPVAPMTGGSHAAWILHAIRGTPATDLEIRSMDAALILHADHDLNASTFAARVTASTLSDIYSAITSAIGALKGPLHGGANERAMELLEEIGTLDRVEEVVRSKLAHHERIMGFGHRVYKVEDPRATIMREWSRRIGEAKGNLHYYELLRKEEQVVFAEKKLYPNVDLYSGSIYALLDIPKYLFTPIFAASRVSGWTAHVLEEYQDLRLIRPTSRYVGPTDVPYVSIEKRS
ncbi:MAG: citrate synthase [Thermoplasmata archaeon]|nr:citrate synthase [Thermoplasmata archaeon]